MSTGYTQTDSLPKDGGAAKFAAVTDDQTSQSDFAMIKGIGASPFGNPARRLGHTAIGTHTQGSPLWTETPGVMIGGIHVDQFTAAASPVAPGQFQQVLVSNWGEMFISGAPKTASHLSTSRNTIKTTSGIVYGFSAGWSAATEASPITISDNLDDKLTIMVHNSSGFGFMALPNGGIHFGTSIRVTAPAGVGNASIVVIYR